MDGADYFQIDLSQQNTTPSNIFARLEYTFQNPVLIKPSDYIISITRFGINARFPLFFPVIPDPTSPLTTDVSITFGYTGVFYQQFVQVTADEVKNGVFSITEYLRHVNDASAAAFALLVAANPGIANMAPYFAFNPDSQIISMYVDTLWEDGAGGPQIFFNQALQAFMNLPATNYKIPPNTFGLDYQILVPDSSKLIPAAGARVGYPVFLSALAFAIIQVEQEYAQTNNFVDLNKLLFTSANIPVVKQFTPVNTSPTGGSTTQSSFQNVLTDFSIASLDHNFTFISYLPTAEFRRISMLGNKPMDVLDISVTYTTFSGGLYNIILPPGGSLDIQLTFEKKKLYY